MRTLYEKACDSGEDLFLDKTPRYYNIIPEIAGLFPYAKFIFLFRHPLAVIASICNTWYGGHLCFANNYADVYEGPAALGSGYRFLKDRSLRLDYESLLQSPQKEVMAICDYLGIEYSDSLLEKFGHSTLRGVMGDKSQDNCRGLNSKSPEKWRFFYNTSLRQAFARKYLSGLDSETREVFGFDPKLHFPGKSIKPMQDLQDFKGIAKNRIKGGVFK